MEQVHHHWIVNEEEEEEEPQDAASKGKHSLQHRKDSIIATAVMPPFSTVGEKLLLQKEEVLHSHKEEQKEHATQKVEETSNVVGNDNNINGDSEEVGLEMLADFVENAMNGEVISSGIINVAASHKKNSVYSDKQQGMWKCHHCTWTKQFDSPWNVPLENLNGSIMKVKTMIQHGPCFVCDSKGQYVCNANISPSTNEYHVWQFGIEMVIYIMLAGFDIRVKNSDIQCSPRNEVNNQCMETVDDKAPPGSELLLLPKSSEIQAETVENCGDEISAKAYPNMSEKIDQQLKELDVEAVLSKQETHDLFCPNCKSCITKRVILRKRKRNIPNIDTIAKRDNFGGTHKPETSQKPSVIPSSNVEKENPSIVVAASNANWLLALFTSNKGRKASVQGDASIEDSRTDPASIEDSRIDNPESPLANTPNQNVNLTSDIKLGNVGVNSPIPSVVKSVVKIESWIEKGKKSNVALPNEPLVDQNDFSTGSSSDVVNVLQKVRGDFSATKQLLNENVRTDLGDKNRDSVDVIKTGIVADISKREGVLVATVATTEILLDAGKPAKDSILKSYEGSHIFDKSQKDVDKTLEIAQDSYSSSMEEAQSPAQSFGGSVAANDVASEKPSSRVDATIPSNQDFKEVLKNVEEEIKPSVAKEKEGMNMKEQTFITSTSQTADSIPIEGAIVTEAHTEIYIGEQPRTEIDEHQEWEILKSIVYGGLVESITSLGVVSSAVASGTAPLNVLAVGLANLIGGLFVIGHNLIDLKNDHSGGDTLQMNVQDRYQELLGHRANFLLHVVVAIFSFLIFGSVPLVVYGLLISKNYHAEVKIAAVAAASVVCIIVLAIGKVYTNRPLKSYVKTVLHYVSLALATSGISYLAGDLVKDLLEKISGSESGSVLTMPLSGTRMKPAWMSY
uniref:Membrane protein of ER body-like protein n=1 Tax=Cajanus cajan TaxID=3821 RepID=A0A151SG30_CAJCA|nr:hypothetical protein KK1_024364 [Cajanus cajan]